MWELAYLRSRWVSRLMSGLTHRLRGQARSHSRSGSSLSMRLNVGAGLPAIAVGQSPHAGPDTPPSRASPLPQLIGFRLEHAVECEAGLPAVAVGQLIHVGPKI